MTIAEPITVARPRRTTEQADHTQVRLSHSELVEVIRRVQREAHDSGQRLPGRPALAQRIGVSTYRVRRALEEIARDDHSEVRPFPTSRTQPANGAGAAVQPSSGSHTCEAPAGASVGHQGISPAPGAGPTPGTPSQPADIPTRKSVDASGANGRQVSSEQSRGAATEKGRQAAPAGARGFYLTAAMSLLVSMNTSWRFFEHNLQITDLAERTVMFAVLEVGLLACGWGMRANVRRFGRPGAPRLFAWLLCGLSSYMAWQLSGMATGIARVALGPALGLVMLHLALGIEIRAHHTRATTWARIGREIRERLVSRLGLADDQRDALARTRDRAARRAARLSLGKIVWFRAARVARALRASNVAHDLAARARMLAELAVLRHANDLATLPVPSPWLGSATEPPPRG